MTVLPIRLVCFYIRNQTSFSFLHLGADLAAGNVVDGGDECRSQLGLK